MLPLPHEALHYHEAKSLFEGHVQGAVAFQSVPHSVIQVEPNTFLNSRFYPGGVIQNRELL